MPIKRNWLGRAVWTLAGGLALGSLVLFNQAYHFTHYDADSTPLPAGPPSALTLVQYGLLGVPNPRPMDGPAPDTTYQEVRLTADDGTRLAAWFVPVLQSRGLVALFHGYHSQRGGLEAEAKGLRQLGFSTLQLDFRGSGASDGNVTSVGYHEAQDVKAAYDWLTWHDPNQKIYCYGSSMGAVAILCSLSQYRNLQPAGLILECPFASLLTASQGRLRSLHLPEEPLSHLIVFTGSLQNGYWGFGHDAVAYAGTVRTPTLLQWGEQDPRVTRPEVDAVLAALRGPKQLVTYPTAAHESYARKDPARWQQAMSQFLR
jgi:alpha-beta hydrolase superfamily lysophospholipase